MLMPGRGYSATGAYRYGFNGKEQDPEVKGTGSQYDYGFRIYDPRLGKFLSVDPLTQSYPWYTPYQFAGNKPIIAIDLDGLEDKIVITDKFVEESRKAVTLNDAAVRSAVENGHLVIMRIKLATGPDNYDTREIVFNDGFISSDVGFIDFSSNGFSRQWTFHYEPPPALKKLEKPIPVDFGNSTVGIIDLEPSDPPIVTNKPSFNIRKFQPPGLTAKKQKIRERQQPKPNTPAPKGPFIINSSSQVAFKQDDNIFKDKKSARSEAEKIHSVVNSKEFVDYSITIYGNFEGGRTTRSWSDGARKRAKFETLGDLALARANALKALLTDLGLDPNKIKVDLGNPNKTMTADYKIELTVKP